MRIIYYCKNTHLLRHRSEHTSASVTFYLTGHPTKAIQYKAKHAINLKPDPTILDAGDLALFGNLLKPWSLVSVLEKHPFYSNILPIGLPIEEGLMDVLFQRDPLMLDMPEQ